MSESRRLSTPRPAVPSRVPALGLCLAVVILACGDATSSRAPNSPVEGTAGVQRIVSINPSLTAILLALDARERLVGVDDFSARQIEQVAHLPRVGGLFNPSLEAVVALEPDAVVLVPSVEQRDFRSRLEALHIRVSAFENTHFDQVLASIAGLGELVGRRAAAARRIEAIRSTRSAVERATARRRRVRTVMVIQREPTFIVGSGSFLDEMLAAAGADNLGATFEGPYPRVDIEWLLDVAPDLLLDVSPAAEDPLSYWSRWPGLPAVASGRVLGLDPERVTLPGPYLDRSLEELAVALHGAGVAAEIEAARRSAGAAEPFGRDRAGMRAQRMEAHGLQGGEPRCST